MRLFSAVPHLATVNKTLAEKISLRRYIQLSCINVRKKMSAVCCVY